MHPMQARIGGLLVTSGFALAVVLGVGWAMVVGAALLVVGGLVLAAAAEPLLDLAEETAAVDDVADAGEPQGGAAA
jgi:hypothetical protein